MLPNPDAQAVAQPVRQGAPARRDAQGRAGDPGGGGAARAAGHVRLRRRRRREGAAAADRGRAHRRRHSAIIGKGLDAGRAAWSSRGRTSCGRARRCSCAAAAPRRRRGPRRTAPASVRRSGRMSISEPFIRRPVATTLLMMGVAAGGPRSATAQLPVAALPQVDYPTIVVSTQLPGRERRDHGVGGDDAARAAVRADAVADADDVGVELRHARRSRCSSTLDRNIDAAEQDVQAAINAASNLLPRTLPAPPTYSKSNPADTPVLTLAVSSDTLPLSQVDDYADSILAQKISQVVRRRPGHPQRRAEAGGARAGRSRWRSPAPACRSRTCALALVAANVNQPKGNLDGARQDFTHRHQRSARQGRRLPAAGHRLQERRAGPPRRRGQRRRRRRERAARRLGGNARRTASSAPSSSTCSASRARTSSRSPTRSRRCCRSSRRRCRRASTCTILSDRTETVRASVDDVQFTLVLTIFLVVAGHLRLPAQLARHHHPRRRRAAVADRHLRRHAPVRLLASTTCR